MLILLVLKQSKLQKQFRKGNIASIKVKFSSEQVQVIKDEKGKIVDGDNNQILSIVENWCFRKI